ncbi:MAG: phosphoenolpyruvate carboxykinase (ATP) [Candidatus Staskawiczbacteria bacterium]|nr:phosphoenolpyruvate carboxykinase (ATP) [Candidatus Staskawiczbacteria bacterium]
MFGSTCTLKTKLKHNSNQKVRREMNILDLFSKTVDDVITGAAARNMLVDNPSESELRQLVARQPGVKQTRYGSFVVESGPSSRAAMFTKNSVDSHFGDDEERLLAEAIGVLSKERIISLDRVVGDGSTGTTVRLVVPERFAHIALGGNLFLPPAVSVKSPTYNILFFADNAFEENRAKPLPRKDITIRLAMLPGGKFVKVVRNSNYIGEYKKGVFAAENWATKTIRGGIFLHAGCREDRLQNVHGDFVLSRTLLVALSANGKTTTTCRILARKGMEESWMVQDDGGSLMPDGSFHGFEGGGIFVKTERVNPGEQTEIFYGLLRPETVHENVWVSEQGCLDFDNVEITSNGRAVVRREHLMHASPHIGVERIDNLILITRGPLIPAISKLTLEQATALMILGQAMESSAGDPTKAGQIRSEFFYDPFVIGSRIEHANIFYRILKGLPYKINCYLLNTGWIGEGEHYRNITLQDTMGILDSLLRGGLEDWTTSPTGLLVPKAVRTVDSTCFHPEKHYSVAEFMEKQKALNAVRRGAIEKFQGQLDFSAEELFQ